MNRLLTYIILGGNALFILWITFNGIDEGFHGNTAQIFSYVALTILLLLNSVLIVSSRRG